VRQRDPPLFRAQATYPAADEKEVWEYAPGNSYAMEWLAFWAKNMTAIGDAGMQWPGFSYTAGERVRMA